MVLTGENYYHAGNHGHNDDDDLGLVADEAVAFAPVCVRLIRALLCIGLRLYQYRRSD